MQQRRGGCVSRSSLPLIYGRHPALSDEGLGVDCKQFDALVLPELRDALARHDGAAVAQCPNQHLRRLGWVAVLRGWKRRTAHHPCDEEYSRVVMNEVLQKTVRSRMLRLLTAVRSSPTVVMYPLSRVEYALK